MGSRQNQGSGPTRAAQSFRQENIHTNMFTPRTYQVELLDAARQRNTIVCLGAAAGKSFIATLLIKEMADQVTSPRNKRTVFLVETATVVDEQARVVAMHSHLSVGRFTHDFTSQDQWDTEFERQQVLVMTADVFLAGAHSSFVTMSQINLLIFDECHLAVGSHPYVEIMKYYDGSPRILGLTASVLGGRCKTSRELEQMLSNLEVTFQSIAETSTDMVVPDVYSARPTEIVLECDPYKDDTGLVEELDSILAPAISFLQDCGIGNKDTDEKDPCVVPRTVLVECQTILRTLGPWCAGKVAQVLARRVTKVIQYETSRMTKLMLHLANTQLCMVHVVVEQVFDKDVECLDDFLRYISPKAQRLLWILHQYKPPDNFVILGDDSDAYLTDEDETDDSLDLSGDDDNAPARNYTAKTKQNKHAKDKNTQYVAVRRAIPSGDVVEPDDGAICGIVFVERRHTAFALNKLITELCNWDTELFFVRSHHMTGRTGKGAESEMLYKKQEEVLRQFRQRELNLLIATGILEEGVDVPKCNLIVRFDLPTSYNSYVHSKGRARAPNSKYYMLMDKNGDKFSDNMETFKGIEKILISRCHNWEEEVSHDVVPALVANALLPPYTTTAGDDGATVNMTSAITLVNRYCAKLPSDTFTHLAPHCTIEMCSEGDSPLFRGVLQLPINSPIKEEIRGEAMKTKKLAKMAVALKASQILHKAGELDDRLMPVGKDMIKYEDDDNEWEDHETLGHARPGTTKHKQYYYKRIARSLVGRPEPGTDCFLYHVAMTLTCPITEEQNTRGRRIYAPEETTRTFGIVSSKLVPQMSLFPVFTRSGEVTVSLNLVSREARYTETELERLLQFHHFLFGQVLRLDKDPMRFEPRNASCGYIVVPLNADAESRDIDWPFVEMISKSSTVTKKTRPSPDTEEFVFDRSQFEDAVVMPSYRNTDQPQYFYVAEIRDDLTPTSAFPSPEAYRTFQDYYSSKYELTITSLSQPLLDVDHTSARLNLLTPRYMNQKGVALPTSSAETRRARRENLQQKQILIPELCYIHPFPASLWRKAICIPAVLYRVNCLLVAEELRVVITDEAHIGVSQLPDGFRFPKLQFGFEMKPGLRAPSGGEQCDCSGVTPVNDGNVADDVGEDGQPKAGLITDDESVDAVVDSKLEIGSESKTFVKLETDAKTGIGIGYSGDDGNGAVDRNCENGFAHTKIDGGINGVDVSNAVLANYCSKQSTNLTESNDATLTKIGLADTCSSGSDMMECDSCVRTDVLTGGAESCHKRGDDDTDCHSTVTNTVICGEHPCGKGMVSNHGGSGDPNALTVMSREVLLCSSAGGDGTEVGHVETSVSGVDGEDTDVIETGRDSMNKLVENGSMDLTSGLTDVDIEVDPQLEIGAEDRVLAAAWDEDKNCSKICNANGCDTNNADMQVMSGSVDVNGCTSDGTDDCDKDEVQSEMNAADFCHDNRTLSRSFNTRGNEHPSACAVDSKTTCRQCARATIPGRCTPPFTFDTEVDLDTYVGPTSCTVLQSLTMSNANDFFNLERLETIGDSFLKFAITAYLYCTYPGIHEGKLSYLRSKQVSNYNLYRQGKRKGLAECMIATKFEPMENWLPPGFVVSQESAFKGLDVYIVPSVKSGCLTGDQEQGMMNKEEDCCVAEEDTPQQRKFNRELAECLKSEEDNESVPDARIKYLIPYNLQTQHSLPDKSIADCVEALIGCYLTSCSQRAALQFMSWLGLKVLPDEESVNRDATTTDASDMTRGSDETPVNKLATDRDGTTADIVESPVNRDAIKVGQLRPPPSPLLMHVPRVKDRLDLYLVGAEAFERNIQYHFRDRSYLLQAFTHASYHYNTLTDCYQRLEFLGDAILDYVITRHLFEDPVRHSPGILTDLRSALVNNNIFAALAVKCDFHKFFKALSPQLFLVIDKFVSRQKENNDEINMDEEFDDLDEDDSEVSEDTEIPKALGDIFESVAGAIYLDSGMSLDTVWRVYYRMMKPQIDTFTAKIPKSPVRELLEMEPETAKFEKPMRTLNGRIRVTVNVVGKGVFQGIGRNYRIAKSAAAKRALKHVRQHNREMERMQHKERMMFHSMFGQ